MSTKRNYDTTNKISFRRLPIKKKTAVVSTRYNFDVG